MLPPECSSSKSHTIQSPVFNVMNIVFNVEHILFIRIIHRALQFFFKVLAFTPGFQFCARGTEGHSIRTIKSDTRAWFEQMLLNSLNSVYFLIFSKFFYCLNFGTTCSLNCKQKYFTKDTGISRNSVDVCLFYIIPNNSRISFQNSEL